MSRHQVKRGPDPAFRFFTVTTDRTTTYRVRARDTEEAIDRMIDGTADCTEVDGVTHKIDAEPEETEAPS